MKNIYSLLIKYRNKEINTNSIAEFISENLEKYEPNTLRGQKNALASYTKFQKIYNKIEWEKITRIIPSVQQKFFPTVTEEELENASSTVHSENQPQQDHLEQKQEAAMEIPTKK